jgi:murein DD-endopeptidase MepM/ murein hydrolase activator NlpD
LEPEFKSKIMALKFNTERWQKWRENTTKHYRFVIMNEDTFEEVGSYKLTLMNLYIFISTLLVLLTFLVFLLIAYTPIKEYLPGFQPLGNNDRRLLELTKEVNRMGDEMQAQEVYINNLKRMLTGNPIREKDVPKVDMPDQSKKGETKKVGMSDVDEELRREDELERVGRIAKQARSVGFAPSEKAMEQLFFAAPVNGEISAHFDRQKSHYGVDVLAPRNTAIKAAMDGFVFLSEWTLETGNTVGIQHDNGILSFYKHNSSLLKKVGNFVRAGEAIAIVGNTGVLSSGPHLHFELWHKGKPVDPVDYVTF